MVLETVGMLRGERVMVVGEGLSSKARSCWCSIDVLVKLPEDIQGRVRCPRKCTGPGIDGHSSKTRRFSSCMGESVAGRSPYQGA